MLLRRVTLHVGEQNWAAIAIDFVIVVVGVFIGIQVSNWNEDRTAAEQSQEILSGVAEDLRLNLVELESGKEFALGAVRAGIYLLEQVGEEPNIALALGRNPAFNPDGRFQMPEVESPDAAEKLRLWSSLLAGYYPTGSLTAYETLTNTGRLGLIQDLELVRGLQNYWQLNIGLAETNAGTMRPLRNQAIGVGQRYGLSPLMQMSEQDLFDKVSESSELRATVRTQLEYNVIYYRLLETTAEAASEILQKLGSG